MKVEFPFTVDDLVDTAETALRRSGAVRSSQALLLAVLVAFAVFLVPFGDGLVRLVVALVAAGCAAFVFPRAARATRLARLRRVFQARLPGPGPFTCEVEISPAGVVTTQLGTRTTRAWSSVAAVEDRGDSIEFVTHRAGTLIVRNRAFRSQAEWRKFLDTARAYFGEARSAAAPAPVEPVKRERLQPAPPPSRARLARALPVDIRPVRWPLALMAIAVAVITVLAEQRAFVDHDVRLAWLPVFLAVLMLPLVPQYLCVVRLEPDAISWQALGIRTRIAFADARAYGEWEYWAYRSGRWRWLSVLGNRGERIDVCLTAYRMEDRLLVREFIATRLHGKRQEGLRSAKYGWKCNAVVATSALLIALSAFAVVVGWDLTLREGELFSRSAILGFVLGGPIGLAIARKLAPSRPAGLLVAVILASMLLLPALAFGANLLFAPRQWHTARVTVVEKNTWVDRHGSLKRDLVLRVDDVRKELSPPKRVWDALAAAKEFSGCVRDGGLGYPIAASLVRPCR